MTEKKSEAGYYMTKQIGSTTYLLSVFFHEDAKETMEDKILRMIDREVSTNRSDCDIIKNATDELSGLKGVQT